MHLSGAFVLKEFLVFIWSLVPCIVRYPGRPLRGRLQVMGRAVRRQPGFRTRADRDLFSGGSYEYAVTRSSVDTGTRLRHYNLSTSISRGFCPVRGRRCCHHGSVNRQAGEVLVAGNWDGFAAMFTEDGAEMPPNEALLQGRAAIREWLGTLGTITAYTQEAAEVDGRHRLAYYRGTYLITFATNGESVTDRGKNLIVLRKQPDGSWQISAAIWNSDLPLEPQN